MFTVVSRLPVQSRLPPPQLCTRSSPASLVMCTTRFTKNRAHKIARNSAISDYNTDDEIVTRNHPVTNVAISSVESVTPNARFESTAPLGKETETSSAEKGITACNNSIKNTRCPNETNNRERKKSFKDEIGVEDFVLVGLNTVLAGASLAFNTVVLRHYKDQLKKLIPFIYFSVSGGSGG